MKYLITILLILLTGCSNNLGAELPAIELSTSEKIATAGIDNVLKDKTKEEKVSIKSKELAKVKLSKFKKDDIDIEIIGDIKEIDGGIELFAKAWKNGEQLGFGKDGTVEIERFRFFNPPVLVDDDNGDIVREWTDEITKEKKQRKLKYDPQEAIKQSLAHTLGIVAKDDKNIVKGKIGNTTSTFYPDAGDTSIYVAAAWQTAHDATTGTLRTGVAAYVQSFTINSPTIERYFATFDTSAIADTDTIDSATLTVTSGGKSDSSQGITNEWDVNIFNSTHTNTVVAGDYDLAGTTAWSTSVTYGNFPVANSTQDFSFNSAGITGINTSGKTKLCMREASHDAANTIHSPDISQVFVGVYNSSETGTTQDPKLVVVHTAAVVETTPPPVLIFE